MTTAVLKCKREAFEMTQKLFHDDVVKRTMQKYQCSRNQALYCHPKWVTDQKHFELCRKHVANGGELSRVVLDSLEDFRSQILHDYPERHRWYVRPNARSHVGRATIPVFDIVEVFSKH